MSRAPCTCSVWLSPCPVCLEYAASLKAPLRRKRRGKDKRTLVYVNGMLTYTRYSRGMIKLLQRLRDAGMSLDDIAERTGVPYGSVRYVMRMELKERAP